MNKEQLLKDVLTVFESHIRDLRKAVASNQEMTRDAPGRIESRYDTSREETGWLATGQAATLGELEHNYQLFRSMPCRTMHYVAPGAYFEAVSFGGRRLRCLVCPGGAGLECATADGMMMLVSPDSPIAVAALGKTAGDVFTVNDRIDYQLLSVA